MSMPMACRKCRKVMFEVKDEHDNFGSVTVLPGTEDRLGVDERGDFWDCQHCHHHNRVQKIPRPDGSQQLRFL